ncbi:hypothetical protein BH23ACT10_BH23ACT10_08340 [soil metagenome]
MPTERFTVVALPYSVDEHAAFHVSVFVAPRLTPDHSESLLKEFETFLRWTEALAKGEVTLANDAGPLAIEPLLSVLEPTAWPAAFPPDTPVRGITPPRWDDRHWRTFRAAETHDTAKLLAFVAMAVNPTAPGTPDAERDPLVALMTRLDDFDVPVEQAFTEQFDEALGESTDRALPLAEIEQRIASTDDTLGRAFLELHRGRRFYERPESAVADPQPRPTDGATREPLPPPEPDFHDRVSLLGDHPAVLRRLGLVVDLRVHDRDALAASRWITAQVTTDTGLTGDTARTACEVVGTDLVTVPRTDEWLAGRLRVGDPELFGVLDMDADGATLKIDRFLWTIPHLVEASQAQADATTATPAQRSAGFTVVRHRRALQTQDRMARQETLGAEVEAGKLPLLDAEDVTQGYRLEVYDDTAGAWFTLHARRVDTEVADHGVILSDEPEDGFSQGTTASETAGVDDSPVHVHEAMVSWGGWSLSAPRPGKRVRHEAGEEIVEDPDTDPAPVTPIVFHNRVEPGTLPRLRYGRSYALRAWGVDLAGNSRPHEVGAPPEPPDDLVARIDARLGDPGRFAPSPGLDTLLRGEAAAAFVRRRQTPSAGPVFDPRRRDPLTGLAAVDAAVVSRLADRRAVPRTRNGRSQRLAAVDRATLIGQAFEDLVLDGDRPLVVDPGFHDPAVVAGGIDHVGDLVDDAVATVTPLHPYLRWEPVQPPTVVARHGNSPGESLLQLVIRSDVTQDPGTLTITVTPPDADVFGYGATSERHLTPPKSSQSECELHGMFDDAIGSGDPDDHRRLLGVAVREAGTWFDVDVPRLDDPTVRDPQPRIALVNDPGVPASTLKSLPLEPGEPPTPGQYVVHDVDEPRVPYLPDPLARGISMVFPDAGRDRQLLFPFGVEGFTATYGGDWPERRPFRLVLEGADDLTGRVEGSAIHLGLPPGDVQRLRLSSSLARASLDLFGVWRSLPDIIRDNDVVAEAAADGWLWILTPADRVTLVHAVPRPLEAPRPTRLTAVRTKGSVESGLVGAVDVHGPSTEQVTAEATWTEVTDDLSLPVPQEAEVSGVGWTTVIRPEEDLAVLAGAVDVDVTVEIPGFGPVTVHRAVHRWGDTKHRRVTYRFHAGTRYREYFDPLPDGGSVVGPDVALSVPSSAPPAAPIVHSVLPLLRWEVGDEPEQPMAVRRSRRPGVRIYLERPWYSSGEGELLAVLVAPGGSDVRAEGHMSQWGADPVWLSSEVDRRAMLLEFDTLMRTLGLDDRPGDARPVAPPVTMAYGEVAGSPQVTVLGYRPRYNLERGLWYVDVAIDPGDRIWPFVRLAVARYQPDSVDGCHLSQPVRCDFVQLLPERTLSVARTDERHVRVVVSGPVGIRGSTQFPPATVEAATVVARNRRLVARLQRTDSALPTDLGWETVHAVELELRGAGRTAAEGAWVGELRAPVDIPLAKPGERDDWRITVEEWELLLGDPADLGIRGPGQWERRLAYADEVPL